MSGKSAWLKQLETYLDVDVVAAKDLNAEDLAPGGDVGRLTVFTKSAWRNSTEVIIMNAYDIIIQPWLTEKSMEARSTQQRLSSSLEEVHQRMDIAKAVETIFDVEVEKVNVRNSKHGKHASVKLAEGYDAEDAAMRLGAF